MRTTLRTTLPATLLCVGSLILPCTHGQQTVALRKQFLEYKAKAEGGDAVAQNNLGMCYYSGQGVRNDYVEAVKWFRKAAEQSYAVAEDNLGQCYATGHGVESDYAEAVNWFRKAAEQNYGPAQYNLGQCYRDGQGMAKDEVEAVKWIRRAADQNYSPAQYHLGLCYYNGQGVAKDFVEAYAWLNFAAKTYEAAARGRDALAEMMSPQQLADGYKRTEELRAQIEANLKSRGKPDPR